MSPAASSSSFSGDSSPPSHLPLSLHLLSTTVATAVHSSSSDSDMDANNHRQHSADETSSASPSPPHPPSNSPSPPPPPPPGGKHHHPPATSAPPPPPRAIPAREDCWSEEATQTLVDAWGERYLDLKRGNLRQKHWQEVADAVNAAHAHTQRLRRTDVQCKNRIDTIKKKYKIEKARTVESLPRRGGGGGYVSPWPIFSKLDALIGDVAATPGSYNNNNNNNNKPIPPPPPEHFTRKPAQSAAAAAKQPPSNSPATPALVLTSPVPVGPRSFKPKRPAAMDSSFYRRTFAAAAAAAAAAPAASSSEEDLRDSEDEEISRSSGLGGMGNRGRRRRSVKNGGRKRTRRRCGSGDSEEGCKQLADAILRFGEIYERVETMKQEQIVELEKHRMEFSKELEFQRMKLLMDTQLQLAKIKRLKPSSNNDDVGEALFFVF